MSKNAEIKLFGDNAFLITWSDEISEHNHLQVTTMNEVIKNRFKDLILETTPAFQSLAVFFKEGANLSHLIESINHLLNENEVQLNAPQQKVHIPVCYDSSFGLDLDSLSDLHNLSIESIIAHHTKPVYSVQFIGFLPGFPYLEGLNPLIASPRKEKPRKIVKAGSVGIAGNQTGVYPMDSPGGWNIIGRSPISFFDVQNSSPSLLKAGDRLVFEPISKSEYIELKKAVEKNNYQLKTTTLND